MEIKLNKTYRSFNGREVTITKEVPESDPHYSEGARFEGNNYAVYSSDGRFVGIISPDFDLMEEVIHENRDSKIL